ASPPAGATPASRTASPGTAGIYDADAAPATTVAFGRRGSTGGWYRVWRRFPGARARGGHGSGRQGAALSEYHVLHLAAHGIVSTKVPARSALVLRPSEAEDGPLQARE